MTVKFIGNCDVDAGLLMIGDPCYHVKTNEGIEGHLEWLDWLNKYHLLDDKHEAELEHKHGGTGAGVVASTAFGDGSFPVYRCAEGTLVVVTDFDYRAAAHSLRELAAQLDKEAEEDEKDA